MDLETVAAGAVGLGVLIASVHNGWQSAQTRRAAKRTEATLTTNNGGSHVKDALDRMEAAQARTELSVHELREDFRDHKADARKDEQRTDARLSALEQRPTTHVEVQAS